MKFATVSTKNALGMILAHGVAALRKGHKLSGDDLQALAAEGITQVIAIELEEGDVHEDEAAKTIADALSGANIRVTRASTGRANIHATANGLAQIDATLINRINKLHSSITVATLKPLERVDAGQMLATIKIIPFASPHWAVESAAEIARQAPLSVSPFARKSASLISTKFTHTKPSLLNKTREVLTRRLAQLECSLRAELQTSHEPAAIEQAIRQCIDQKPDLILIMGASATADEGNNGLPVRLPDLCPVVPRL